MGFGGLGFVLQSACLSFPPTKNPKENFKPQSIFQAELFACP